MRAIGFDTWGGPEVLHPVTLPDPVAGEGEILVRVAAAGVAPGRRDGAPVSSPRSMRDRNRPSSWA